MTALLRDALAPNLVQTLENNPAFIHGGPFANIAHGCNSVMATGTALKLADYVVTEAGFGADLGAEKFVDIKCRKAGLTPSAAVIVATIRALKYHGGVDVKEVGKENLVALEKGIVNLERHIHNVRNDYGLQQRRGDQPSQRRYRCRDPPVAAAARASRREDHRGETLRRGRQGRASSWRRRSYGCATCLTTSATCTSRSRALWDKMKTIATQIYGALDIVADSKIRAQIKALQDGGYGQYPVCVAKTQYSFSTDPKLRGAPSGHVVNIREVRLAAGAEFIVMICGDIMTMPGLPKVPAANTIDVDATGKIVGLF